MTETRDIELNTGTRHKCENSDASKPMVFAADLSDEELAEFLENLAIKIRARLRSKSRPDFFRKEAEKAESEITELNNSIDSTVCRKNQDPTQNYQSSAGLVK